MPTSLNTKVAHNPSATCLVFHPKDRTLFTGGSDVSLKLHSIEEWSEEAEPLQSWDVHEEALTTLAVSSDGKFVATGSEDFSVQLYSCTDRSHLRLACRLAATVRCVAFDSTGTRLAIASSEPSGVIRIVSIEASDECTSLAGHSGPVMAVAWSADGQTLASAGSDRSLRIWNVSERSTMKAFPNKFSPSTTKVERKFSLQFATLFGVEVLVVPVDNGLQFLSATDGYKVLSTLLTPQAEPPRLFAIRPTPTTAQTPAFVVVSDGATACAAFRVDDLKSGGECVETFQVEGGITDLDWATTTATDSKEIVALANVFGTVSLWPFPIREHLPAPEPVESAIPAVASKPVVVKQRTVTKVSTGKVIQPKSTASTSTSAVAPAPSQKTEKQKSKKPKPVLDDDKEPPRSRFIAEAEEDNDDGEEEGTEDGDNDDDDDEMEEDLDEEEAEMVRKVKQRLYRSAKEEAGEEEDEVANDEEDDIEEVEHQSASQAAQPADGALVVEGDEGANQAEDVDAVEGEQLEGDQPITRLRGRQEAFQPNSTPEESGHRILACNSVGVIKWQKSAEDGRITISIEFNDVNRYKHIRMIDRHNISMAALGGRGAILASNGEQGTEGMLLFKPIEIWGTNADWTAQLPPSEQVVGVAIGNTFVTAFTTRYMRVFSCTGLEQAVLSLPYRYLSSTGSERMLAAFFDDGLGNVYCSVYDMEKRAAVHQHLTVPLTPGTNLMWVGWSDEQILASCDTVGVVRVLSCDYGQQWVPVYDPNNTSEAVMYWPVGLTRQKLYAIPCQPSRLHPSVSANFSVPTPVDLRIPLTPSSVSLLRETYLRQLIHNGDLKRKAECYTNEIQLSDVELDKITLQLFDMALKKDQTARALELAFSLNMRKSLEIAMRKAHEKSFTGLVEKLNKLHMAIFGKTKKWACALPEKSQKEKDRLIKQQLREYKSMVTNAGTTTATSTDTSSSSAVSQSQTPGHSASPQPTSSPSGATAASMTEDSDTTEISTLNTGAATPMAQDLVSKRLFPTQQQDTPATQKDPMASSSTPSAGFRSPFASFSPNEKAAEATPTSLSHTASLLASMKPPVVPASQQFSQVKAATKPFSGPASSSSFATGKAPHVTMIPIPPRSSAPAGPTFTKFQPNTTTNTKNPAPMIPAVAPQPQLSSPSPAVLPSPPAAPAIAPMRPITNRVPVEKAAPTRIHPDVSSELGGKAMTALKRQLEQAASAEEQDDEDPFDVPALKVQRTV